MAAISTAIARTRRGLGAAVRSRAHVVAVVAAAVAAFSLAAPVALLSVARRPVDFFTFNPWLRRLPDYVLSAEPLGSKLAYLWHLSIAWASADGRDGIDWGFIVDVPTLARVAFTSLLVGAWFALWSYTRERDARAGGPSRRAGVLGAVAGAFGVGAGPCSLAGCGAPVLPVLGLAFTSVSAGALAVLAAVSRVVIPGILVAMTAAVLWLAWRAGEAQSRSGCPGGDGGERSASI